MSISIIRQNGVALFVSLIILLMLTLIGLAASQITVQQERMAGNVRESNQAFQEAEATLREIEQRVRLLAQGQTGGLGTIPLWGDDPQLVDLRNDCTLERRYGGEWDDVPWREAPTTGNDYYVIDLSDYIVSGLPVGSSCRPVMEAGTTAVGEYYLILARAYGPGDASRRAEAVVQSIFFWPG